MRLRRQRSEPRDGRPLKVRVGAGLAAAAVLPGALLPPSRPAPAPASPRPAPITWTPPELDPCARPLLPGPATGPRPLGGGLLDFRCTLALPGPTPAPPAAVPTEVAPPIAQPQVEVKKPDKPKPPPPIGARPSGKKARAAWYQRIVERQGHTWRTGKDQLNVIGLRAFDVEHGRNRNTFNLWNDTIAFVWTDARGRVQLREYRATTDPGEKWASDTPDVNHDGNGDVASVDQGQYRYGVGTHHGVYGAGVPARNVRVDRDTNHDGRIEPGEERASDRRGDVGYGINLHWSTTSPGQVDGYSLGCQVLAMDYARFRREVTPLLEKGAFLYTLVDMRQVV